MKNASTWGSIKTIFKYTITCAILLCLSCFLFYKANTNNDSMYMQDLPKDMLKAPEVNLTVKKSVYKGNATPSKHGIPVVAPIPKADFADSFSYFSCQDIDQIGDVKLKKKVANILEDYGMASFEVISGVLSIMKLDDSLTPVGATSIDVRTGETIELRDLFADNVDASYELNRKISYYMLTHSPADFRIDEWKGISLDTPFLVYEDFSNKNTYVMLFFNSKTPALAGKTLTLNLRDFGNNGDVIAYYNRFPAFKSFESFTKQTKIEPDPLNQADIYYAYGEKKDPWAFYKKYQPENYADPEIVDVGTTDAEDNLLSSPQPTQEPIESSSGSTLGEYDGRFDKSTFSGTSSQLLKIPLSEYVLDKNKKVKLKDKIDAIPPSFGTDVIKKDFLNKFYIYKIPFGLGS